MTLALVPTPDGTESFWSETVALDGTAFILAFSYVQRQACWTLTISTLDGDLVCAGLKLVTFWNLLGKSASPLRPPGWFLVLPNSADTSTPGLFDLAPGARCVLVYVPIADVEAAAAGTLVTDD